MTPTYPAWLMVAGALRDVSSWDSRGVPAWVSVPTGRVPGEMCDRPVVLDRGQWRARTEADQ